MSQIRVHSAKPLAPGKRVTVSHSQPAIATAAVYIHEHMWLCMYVRVMYTSVYVHVYVAMKMYMYCICVCTLCICMYGFVCKAIRSLQHVQTYEHIYMLYIHK